MCRLAILVTLALAFATAVRADEASDFRAAASAFDVARAKGDCTAGAPAAATLAAARAFDSLNYHQQLLVWMLGAYCAAKTNNLELSFEDARRGTALRDAPDWLWRMRFHESVMLNRPDDTADTMSLLVHAQPDVLRTLDDASLEAIVEDLIRRVRRDDVAARMFAALETVNYGPAGPRWFVDRIWFDDAVVELKVGHTDHAVELMRRVTDPPELLRARLDGRLSAAVAADPARFDIAAALDRAVTADEPARAAHPDQVAYVLQVARDLYGLRREREALATLQAALDRIASARGKPAFTDQDAYLIGVLNLEASLLINVGRIDDALAAQRKAAAPDKNGQPDVDASIALADRLIEVGRAQEALQAISAPVFEQEFTKVTPGELAAVHADRACADVQLQRQADLERELHYLAAHEYDSEDARLTALLCADDEQAFVTDLETRLADPIERADILVWLCEFEPAADQTAYEKTMSARMAVIRTRPDVQEAAAKVGRIEHFHLPAGAFAPY